jgi:hypothetical protein
VISLFFISLPVQLIAASIKGKRPNQIFLDDSISLNYTKAAFLRNCESSIETCTPMIPAYIMKKERGFGLLSLGTLAFLNYFLLLFYARLHSSVCDIV